MDITRRGFLGGLSALGLLPWLGKSERVQGATVVEPRVNVRQYGAASSHRIYWFDRVRSGDTFITEGQQTVMAAWNGQPGDEVPLLSVRENAIEFTLASNASAIDGGWLHVWSRA
jgi:hypothetical protein